MNERLRRIGRRAAWTLLVLFVLLVIAWTAGNVSGTWRLEGAVSAMRAAGFPTSPAALRGPKLPPAENAAPLWQAAFALYVEPPEDSSWRDEVDAGGLDKLGAEDLKAVDRWLEGNGEAFAMAARAARRSACRFDRDYSRSFAMELPELPKMFSLAKALSCRAERLARTGHGDQARESVGLMVPAANSVREDAVLISQILRMAVLTRALHTIEACVTASSTPEELEAWQRLVPAPSLLDGAIARALNGEGAMVLPLLQGGVPDLETTLGCSPLGYPLLLRPLLKWDGAHYLEQMRRVAEASLKPYPEAMSQVASIPQDRRGSLCLVCGMFLPALGRILDRAATVQAHAAVVKAGLEAELERARMGRYPERTAIRDPFTGIPLIIDSKEGRLSSKGLEDGQPIEWVFRVRK